MAEEPDNMVLQLLREIRGTLAEHSRFHAEHRQAFAELRDDIREANSNAAYAAGFALLGRRDNEATGERVAKLEVRVKKIEEALEN